MLTQGTVGFMINAMGAFDKTYRKLEELRKEYAVYVEEFEAEKERLTNQGDSLSWMIGGLCSS